MGCGSGYLTFPIADRNPKIEVIGLDIVTNTLKSNREKRDRFGLTNLEFVEYNGEIFPFAEDSFDIAVSRYSLHHFPQIEKSMQEIARVLRKGGHFFVSDPRPNACDETGFVDEYMQMKKDGHIKFYTKKEWMQICQNYGMEIETCFDTTIRFPRRRETAAEFDEIIARHDKAIVDSYDVVVTDEEIWITEEVNNILFCKK